MTTKKIFGMRLPNFADSKGAAREMTKRYELSSNKMGTFLLKNIGTPLTHSNWPSLNYRQQGLGCSICRGPDTRPGIFVQSTRPGGLAAESGIEPGDQVLDCNGVCLQRADFAEAVYLLKNQRRLDLLVRKGVATGA